ncbi:DUF4325 domain-containing protein [Helicobacter sp. MIT 05-5293]|uniref:STAS-like domain-containing protein n=1 Tax=Helicobacter sp. MIT 05-5293 TaxID=1548149 RepID=UPI00051D4F27|nr:DUF4325 domain-containing protein [Helicobacter sp. MIT 05-5293]TLD80160.1 DUF4325 domain-containing protein [Helicobacter sp. MIT 05-5293]
MKQEKEPLVYDFAKEFSETPGPRYKSLGKFSGEAFREDVLRGLLEKYDFIEIDGSNIKTSFTPSFLSEAFAPLSKEMGGFENLSKRVRLFSKTNPNLERKFKDFASL